MAEARDSMSFQVEKSEGNLDSGSSVPPLKLGKIRNSCVNNKSNNSIRVIVRVRPLIARQSTNTNNENCFIKMENSTTILLPRDYYENPSSYENADPISSNDFKKFYFDNCLWSFNENGYNEYADQDSVYNCCGKEFLNHTLEGYNTCIFAYGQTGSGKSYTMFGDNDGLIPKITSDLFKEIGILQEQNISIKITISFFEIYNEDVFDLLDNSTTTKKRIRENLQGLPFVENLNEIEINSTKEIFKYLNRGNSKRKTASTKSNSRSSRSHAVFSIKIHQKEYLINEIIKEKISHLRLVDLAGSERTSNTGNVGLRLKEGSNINKSLTSLGRILTILSENATSQKKQMVPYRESTLTWLLKESIGGNSKSCMICCISPTDYEETYSSLRYATLTKRITNVAKLNNTEIRKSRHLQEFEDSEERENLYDIINDLKSQLSDLNNNSISQTNLNKLTNLIKFNDDRKDEKFFQLKLELNKNLNAHNSLTKDLNDYYQLMLTRENECMANLNKLYDNDWAKFYNEDLLDFELDLDKSIKEFETYC
ncbi:hypothetical protein PACTADRAFT_48065 [Pachysolen tannophilus NRRL Y-2460]|uniref:Kinesin-like protein n=1 Tax=Pachysolen tannophilus NRRL Y-2460 TaxID=669874 RepID=A0A1E4U2P5_PACTA|nr:hypothetical protein PACTADRAFT_48065 [Pachysolen tannophilus NRRL Y-2460]